MRIEMKLPRESVGEGEDKGRMRRKGGSYSTHNTEKYFQKIDISECLEVERTFLSPSKP